MIKNNENIVNPFSGITGAGAVFIENAVETNKKETVESMQRTFEWHLERMFRFTGSQIDALLCSGRVDKKRGINAGHPLTVWGKTALNVIREKKTLWTMTEEGRAEYVHQQMSKEFRQTVWGNENEPFARELYQERTGLKVKEVGFMVNPKCDYHGGSFDGEIIGTVYDPSCPEEGNRTKGIIEIKSPFDPMKHDANLDLMNEVASKRLETGDPKWFDVHHDYYGQIQSNIETAHADWCDFVSFDPRQNEKNRIAIIRIYRDALFCETMMNRIHKAKLIFDLAIAGMTINAACIEVETKYPSIKI